MSVKRKFRKSKKTKGKTKDNNKHKNNEKRSKIQRKTKKRVLRGGVNTELVFENTNDGQRLRGMTGKFSILKPSIKDCSEWFKNIARVYPYPDNPPPIKPDTKAKKDFDYCQTKVGPYTNFSPNSTPNPELVEQEEQEAAPAASVSTDQQANLEGVTTAVATTGQQGAEAELDSGDLAAIMEQGYTGDSAIPEVEKKNERVVTYDSEAAAAAETPETTEAAGEAVEETETAEAAEVAATIKLEKIQKAMKQVDTDKTDNKNIPGGTARLTNIRAEEHKNLASKYKELELKEEDEEIREIYMNAKEYHNRVYEKLQADATIQKAKADLLRQTEWVATPSKVTEALVPVAEAAVVPSVDDNFKTLIRYLHENVTGYTDVDFLSVFVTQITLKKNMIDALKKSLITYSFNITSSLKKDVTEENKTKLAYLAGFLVAVILNNPMIEFQLTFPKHYLDLFFMLQHAPVIVKLCGDILHRITSQSLSSKPFLSLVKKQNLLFPTLFNLSVNNDKLFCVGGEGKDMYMGNRLALLTSNPRKIMTKFIQEQLQQQIQQLPEDTEKELFVFPKTSELSIEQFCREKIFPFVAKKIILNEDDSDFKFYIDDVSVNLKNIVSSFTTTFKTNFKCSQLEWDAWSFDEIGGLLFTLMFANSILFLEKLPDNEKRTYKLLEIFKNMLFFFYSACVESFNTEYMKLVSGCLTCPLVLESPPVSEYGIVSSTKVDITKYCGTTFTEIPCIDVFKDNFLTLLQLLFSTSVEDKDKEKSTSKFIEYYLAFLEIRYKDLKSDSKDPDISNLFDEVGIDGRRGLTQMNAKFSKIFIDKQLPSNFLTTMFTPEKEQDFSLVDVLKGQPLDLTKPSQKDKIIEFLTLFKEAFDLKKFKDVLFGIDGSSSYVDIFGNTSRERSDVWSLPLLLQKAEEIFNSLKSNSTIIESRELQFDYLQDFMPKDLPMPTNVSVIDLSEINVTDSYVSNGKIYTFKIEGRRSILGLGKLTTFYAKIIEKDSKKYIVYSDDFGKINVADNDLESSIHPGSSSSLYFIDISKITNIVSDESDESNKKISFDGTNEQNITKKFTLMFEPKDTNHFVEFKGRLEEIQSSRSEDPEVRDNTFIVPCIRTKKGIIKDDDEGFCGLVADGLFSNFEIRGSTPGIINKRLNFSLGDFQKIESHDIMRNFVDLRLCMNFVKFDKDDRYYLMFMAPDMIEPTKYLGGENLRIPTSLSVLYVPHKFSFDRANLRDIFLENIESKEIPKRDFGLSFVKVKSNNFESVSILTPEVFCGFDGNGIYMVVGSTTEKTIERIKGDMTLTYADKYIDLTEVVELKINSDNSFTFEAPRGVSDEFSKEDKVVFEFTFDDSYTRDFFFQILHEKCEIAKNRKKQFMITKCKKLDITTQKWSTAYFALYPTDGTIVIVANSLQSAISSIYVAQIGSSKENYIDLKNVSFETKVGNSVAEIIFKDTKTANELFKLKSYDDTTEKKEEIYGISSELSSIKSKIDRGDTSTSALNIDCEQFNFDHEEKKDQYKKDKPTKGFVARVKDKIVKVFVKAVDVTKTAIKVVKDTFSGPWTKCSIAFKNENMYILDRYDDPYKGEDITKLTKEEHKELFQGKNPSSILPEEYKKLCNIFKMNHPNKLLPEERAKLLEDSAEKIRDISKKNIELQLATPQDGNEKVIQIERCDEIVKVPFKNEDKEHCVRFKAPQSYGSENMVLYCFAFKDEKDQDLFYKALVERKELLQRKLESEIYQQKVAKQQALKDTTLQLGAPPVQSFKIYVKDAQGIESEKEVNAINCFQFDPKISRSVFKSSSPDVCAISGDFFVRASPRFYNKFGNLKDRLTTLMSLDKESKESAPKECKNHCFDFTKCSALAPLTDNTESQFKDGLTFMGPETIGSKTIVPYRFYFASENERDYAQMLLQEIIYRANLKPFDDTKDTSSRYIRCSVSLPAVLLRTNNEIFCAFIPEFLCFEKDIPTLTELVSSSVKKTKDNSIAFARIDKIEYDGDDSKVKIFIDKSNYYEFDLKDYDNYKLFEKKLRRNYSISQSKLPSPTHASAKVSSAISMQNIRTDDSRSAETTPFGSPSDKIYYKRVADASTIRAQGGGNQNKKNKTKHSTKTNHKPNQKAKAKTQSKSKPKHKNNSKPKHRTKAKTIKKNKRAHHKFDKKYTRRR